MDITNQRFGRLVVLSFAGNRKYKGGNSSRMWNVICDCGNTFVTNEHSLIKGLTRSCGCLKRERLTELNRNRVDALTGKRFGRLMVLASAGISPQRDKLWKVRCDCGCIFTTHGKSLRRGLTRSCGCLRDEMSKERMRQRKCVVNNA